MRFGFLLVCGGCGLFEGVEQPAPLPPCEVLSEVEISDPAQDVGFLAPLGDRLDGVEGTFSVTAVVGAAAYAATFDLAQSGPIRAVEQREPEPSLAPERCASRYVAPMDAALDLDGGELHLALPVEVVVMDETADVRAAVPDSGEDGVWREVGIRDATTADFVWHEADAFTTTLDLGDPVGVTLNVDFEDGVTPSGWVTLLDADEVDGLRVARLALTFD
jgi:hypothetical protein